MLKLFKDKQTDRQTDRAKNTGPDLSLRGHKIVEPDYCTALTDSFRTCSIKTYFFI